MKQELDQLETAVSEIDYLFQEGVIISAEDKARLDNLIYQLSSIASDPFLYVHELPKI